MATAWKMFAAVDSRLRGEPTVHALIGADGAYDWPDGELTNGVAGIAIRVHGDDPTGAFLEVYGPDLDQITAAFDRARDLIRSGALTALLTGEAS